MSFAIYLDLFQRLSLVILREASISQAFEFFKQARNLQGTILMIKNILGIP